MTDEIPADVRVPGAEPVFRHLDDPDVPWQHVKAIRNADGSESSIWEKWLAFSPIRSTCRCTRSGIPAW